jgi:hypothetical protein
MTGASAASRVVFAAARGNVEVRPCRSFTGSRSANHRRADRQPSEARRAGDRPFGRRACEVTATSSGGYRIFSVLDPVGPSPPPGSSTCWPPSRDGVPTEAPYLARAFSSPTRSAGGGVRLDFLVQAVGPGTGRLARWSRRGCGSPARSAGRSRRPPSFTRRPGAILVGGGIGVAPLAIWRRRLQRAGIPARVLLGFRDRENSGASTSSTAARSGSPARTAIPGIVATSPTSSGCCSRGRRGQRRRLRLRAPAMLRRSARSAPIAASPASSRWRRRWPAVRACFGCAIPLSSGGTCGSASTARSSAAKRSNGARSRFGSLIEFCGIELRHP